MYKKNIKNIFTLLVLIIILIFLVVLLLDVKKSNYKIKYKNIEFQVSEKAKNNNYYIEIKNNKKVYPISLNTKSSKIKDVYYYEDDKYQCLLPIINDNIKLDVMCYYNNILYNYSTIKGKNNKLDKYINSIKEYDINNFVDNKIRTKQNTNITIYSNNIVNRKVAVTTYRGINNLSNEIRLFNDDVYDNDISIFINQYYIVADYNMSHEFNYFYIVDLDNNNVSKIKSKYDISFDSYIEGIVDNLVYLYDRNSEIQYTIDIKNKNVTKLDLDDEIKIYKDGKWSKISKAKANKKILFDYTTLDNDYTNYDYVIKNDTYYYLFKKENDEYKLYRVDKNNLQIIKYLFNIKTTDIKINDDYLYYKYKNKLYYYSDTTGFRTLIKNTEFKFNNTIKYYVY